MADAVIVAALAALCFGWLYLRERLVAIEKRLPHPQPFLHIGIPMLTVGVGTMVALRRVGFPGWPFPLPVALSGRKGQSGSRGE